MLTAITGTPANNVTTTPFLQVVDVMKILDISETKAYEIMSQLNMELKSEGYLIVRGRVSSARFWERYYGGKEAYQSCLGTGNTNSKTSKKAESSGDQTGALKKGLN